MLTKKELDSRKCLEYSCLKQLVPKNHLLRKIDKIIDFYFIGVEAHVRQPKNV